jgi:hypothetical protein
MVKKTQKIKKEIDEKSKETILKSQDSLSDSPSEEIPQDVYSQLQGQINDLKGENKTLNDLLLQVADKKQLALYYQRNKDKVPPVVKLRTIDGKVIVGWRTLVDKVDQDPVTLRWREKQTIEVLYEDGSSQQFALMDYVKLYKHIEADVISTINDSETGKVVLKTRTRDGREYVIGVEYVN